MSGIYGIFRYGGAPVESHWLEKMRNAMSYYGPDGSTCRTDGPVGMGHLLLAVNPEDVFEGQPYRVPRGLVACTARLDNRDALLEAFSIPPSDASQTADGKLVSLAFDRWGEEVCAHLEGDWALAAWDANARRLVLARDIWGLGGLYYFQGKGFVAFASSMKALLTLPGVRKEPDFLRLAEILVSWHNDAELTAYKGFRSVIGAHAMIFAHDGQLRDKCFWSYGLREPLRYRRDEDYVEAFLEHYTRAVKNCLRTQKPIAAELSGGRDSGSVVTMAAPILAAQGRELTAYTSVPWLAPDGAGPGRVGNEWDLAHATATMAGPNVKHVPVDAREYSVLGGIEHFQDMHDGPGHAAVNQYWIKAELDTCRSNGASVLLGGGMGNATVSWSGNGSVILALLQGDYATARRLIFHGESNPWYLLKRQILKPLLTPGRRVLRRLKSRGSGWQAYSALNANAARDLDLDARMKAAGYDPTFTSSPQEDFRKQFFWPEYGTASCIMSESMAWHRVTCPDPTANLAMLEFLLRVPDDQFYRRGQYSSLIQRAFQGRMPASVLAGRQKGLQAADVGHRIVRELPKFQECLRSLESVPEIRGMLDFQRLHGCLEALTTEVNPASTQIAGTILCRTIGVGLFIYRIAGS